MADVDIAPADLGAGGMAHGAVEAIARRDRHQPKRKPPRADRTANAAASRRLDAAARRRDDERRADDPPPAGPPGATGPAPPTAPPGGPPPGLDMAAFTAAVAEAAELARPAPRPAARLDGHAAADGGLDPFGPDPDEQAPPPSAGDPHDPGPAAGGEVTAGPPRPDQEPDAGAADAPGVQQEHDRADPRPPADDPADHRPDDESGPPAGLGAEPDDEPGPPAEPDDEPDLPAEPDDEPDPPAELGVEPDDDQEEVAARGPDPHAPAALRMYGRPAAGRRPRRPRTPGRGRGRRAGLALGALAAAAAITFAGGALLRGGGAAPAADPAAPDPPAAAAGGGVTMQTWRGIGLPTSAAGPAIVQGDQVGGFADDELGAASAAAHLSVRLDPAAGPATFGPVLQRQVRGDRDRLAAALQSQYAAAAAAAGVTDGGPLPASPGVLAGYRVQRDGPSAAVHLLVAAGDGTRTDYLVPLTWTGGDWAVDVPASGPVFVLADPAGDYTPFQPEAP